jgi:ABC-type antimicrobial peptide transport system permease subunit
MLKNYIKIAWRNLVKEKSFTAINLLGLSLAFAASIMLFLTADFHFSYDDTHVNKNSIYKLYHKVNRPTGVEYSATMAPPVAPTLVAEYPEEIAAVSRMMDSGMLVEYKGKTYELDINYVDPSYFDIFTFTVTQGDKQAPLGDLNNIILREKDAKRIFGNEDPIGKVVLRWNESEKKPLTVSAVLADGPENSTIESSNLARFEIYGSYQEAKDEWSWQNHDVYLLLNPNIKWVSFEKKLKNFTAKYYRDDIEQANKAGFVKDNRGEVLSNRLLPLSEEHFNTVVGRQSISYYYPFMLLGIGILILLIASINFVNLSIVRSLARAKEVGMRKALGAIKMQVIGQFWGEALLICVTALSIGLTAAYFLIPEFNAIINGNIAFEAIFQPEIIAIITISFLLVTALAGGYPAWMISRFNTVEVLKGKVRKGLSNRKLRNTLIVVQFSISVLLITSTIIVWNQLDYLRNKPLGYNQKQVISIPIGHGVDGYNLLDFFRNELTNQPQIMSVTAADNNLGRGNDGNGYKSVLGFGMDGKEYTTNGLNVDFDCIETLELALIAGRSFDRKFATDSSTACVINETMAKQLGGGEKLIGQKIPISGGKEIIGIVKDYHFESLRNKVESNTLFFNKPFGLNYLFVKVNGNQPAATMKLLKDTYLAYNPDGTFQGSFLDENTRNQYKKEERISKIFSAAAMLAIILSCGGLFAIALMVIRNRTKEIGVRKVLGADISTLVALLSKDFIKLVFIAIVIALPLAYYGMSNWLEEFSYRTTIQWWMLAIAGIAAVSIALITVSIHAIRAASANPVNSLRSE